QLTLFHQPFSLNEFYGFNESLNAFKYLLYLSSQINDQQSVPDKQAERVLYHQEQIHPHHYFGQLIYSISLSSQWLDAITTMLESQEQRIICGEGRNQQTAQYLTNVFYKFFATDLQSYLAELDSQYLEIQPILSQLLLQHSLKTPEMTPYINYYLMGEMHEDFRRATLAHVQFWQRVFKRCNIKVGRSPLG
ncbi:DUF3080 family protein, partial [Photobacterium sanctipauli]